MTYRRVRQTCARAGRNLGGPQVDVDAVNVMGKDQPGNIPPQFFQRRVFLLLLECGAKFRVVVRFLVNRQEQVEAIQQEVAAPAGRVEYFEFPWVFLGALRNVGWELE